VGLKTDFRRPECATAGLFKCIHAHHIIASASYKFIYGKYFATTVGLIYEAAPSGVGSYVYNGDLNNDAQTSNDLLYIPTVADHTSGKYIQPAAAVWIQGHPRMSGISSTLL